MVTFGVLGPLEAANRQGPVDLRGPRHRAVLARLLVAGGRTVPVTRLIDDLWTQPPAGALGAVQTFVAALRKSLEPQRPARTPSRLLVTASPGYALRVEPSAVDAGRFENAVAASATLLAEGRAEAAHALLDEGLGLWRGAAYAEFAELDWARGAASRLEELRLLAVLRRAEAAVASGRAADAVPDLEAHVGEHPLREDGWRLLALALYRVGRQGDALAVLRRAREVLRSELGVDPGTELRRLESDVLAQSPHLDARPGPTWRSRQPERLAEDGVDRPASSAVEPATSPSIGGAPAAPRPFVGRTAELTELAAVSTSVVETGLPGLVLLSGEAGSGKTALARMLADRLRGSGWAVAWSSVPELRGAPAAWPWTQVHANLVEAGYGAAFAEPPTTESPLTESPFAHDPAEPRLAWAGRAAADVAAVREAAPSAPSVGDPVAARFHRHRAVVAGVTRIAEDTPVLIVFDDLHWADEETLALLTAVAADPRPGSVLFVGTYRSTELTGALTEALGRAARGEPTRLYLGGLTEPQVGELISSVADREPSRRDVRLIHRRSAGNPFFVRELIRLWEGDAAGPSGDDVDAGQRAAVGVPVGVRDVIRHRLTRLPETARTVLRQAAILGLEVDLEVLTALVGDERAVLDAVESALAAGFLNEQDADRVWFAHALVREALYEDVPLARRAAWHAAVAEIIEAAHPDAVETIAEHLLRAGGRASGARTARYARAAALRAEERLVPHEAARWWRRTITALDRAGRDPRDRLTAVMGLVTALAVVGDLDAARRHRAEATEMAERIGDPLLTAEVIGSFDVPAIWTANDDPALSAFLASAAERTLSALPACRASDRARLLITIAMERRADTGSRGPEAAREAEAIARRLGDPALLAYALNGRFMQSFHRAGLAPYRVEIGEELLDLAARHQGLITFAVLGRLILLQARAALADFGAADVHAAEVDRLAERYELPLVGVFTRWYAALRLAVTGGVDEAEAAYRAAENRSAGTGMPGLTEGILSLARLSLHAPGIPPDLVDADWGSYADWARPLIALADRPARWNGSGSEGGPGPTGAEGATCGAGAENGAGMRSSTCHARTGGVLPLDAAGSVPDSPRDLLFEARTCLHAMIAIRTGDRATMTRLYERLLPAAGELAGAGSGLLTLGPVAQHLGDLAAALGDTEQAADHYRQARTIADLARSPRFAAAAREALNRLGAEA
ncbi:DNA-binding SARP family transcriptional activator [Actinoalloteichus hoggarensis]|uniref:Transcriptional regulatory protein EmbR n=1 Tax=Actinoalloteichus hoggarensis TaxID=1470176 RepID=A0A221W9Y9_9PSEU|nr:BTAD domain-containing putative transcriptional regulator [Actinoalloteichus hoggarensis]ASO22426.1 Transcriptional regulatory protein EmbR [Actinoalloteichus hoggarensis]MBB5923150.1 DNA-binding SARP family transcriptional activator [Actinoalloteichus hoggarensis]